MHSQWYEPQHIYSICSRRDMNLNIFIPYALAEIWTSTYLFHMHSQRYESQHIYSICTGRDMNLNIFIPYALAEIWISMYLFHMHSQRYEPQHIYSICTRRDMNLNIFMKKRSCYYVLIIFLLNTLFCSLMYKKSNSFVYIFVANWRFSKYVRICPIKLKTVT